MRTLFPACAVAAAVSLLLAPAAAPAFATDGPYTVPLHQQAELPLTATSEGVENEADCPVPDGQDGWHFVLPGTSTDFVKLTVTFQPGGEQVVTDFGPPSDKHAYVASAPGAELTSAVAEVEGGEVDWFNLSHTCPASGSSVSATPSTPGASTTEPGGMGDGTSTPSTSATPGASDSAAPSASASAPASASGSEEAADGDLAETGANVGGITAAAVLLLGAGAAMVMLRRRKATPKH